MRHTIILLTALLSAPATGWSQPEDWYKRPVFDLAAADIKTIDLKPLLRAACPGRLFLRQGQHGLEMGCTRCPVGSGFSVDRDTMGGVSVEAVTFGHFVTATSEDVVLGVVGCEPHSNYWGGSYLLTKQTGNWKLLGYYSRLITEQCHKVRTEEGREILVCAHFFGGQGYMDRFLYALDFGIPKKPNVTPLLTVQNGLRACGQAGEAGNLPVWQSEIDSVTFADPNDDGLPEISIVARTGRIKRSDAEYGACESWLNGKEWKNPPRVRTPAYRIDYLLQGSRFIPTLQSIPAKKHFPGSNTF